MNMNTLITKMNRRSLVAKALRASMTSRRSISRSSNSLLMDLLRGDEEAAKWVTDHAVNPRSAGLNRPMPKEPVVVSLDAHAKVLDRVRQWREFKEVRIINVHRSYVICK